MESGISIHEILTSIGYTLKDFGKEYRTKPIYRDSDSDTVLRIYKDTGFWVDFKENISGDFNSLVKLSLKLDTEDDAKAWLKNKNFQHFTPKVEKPKVKDKKIFDKDLLLKLSKDHSYWIKRGVNEETIKLFQGGIASAGKMKDRYVFPIFNSKTEIVGFSGRDITNKSKIKWKHLGDKSSWCYPTFLNIQDIHNSKQVFLIESIGDCLSLHQAGIRNTIVTFGLEVSISILNFLLKIDPSKIYISFNNDQQNNSAGNEAAKKAYNKLLRYFDPKQLSINLPPKKDFGEMTTEEIQTWKTKL